MAIAQGEQATAADVLAALALRLPPKVKLETRARDGASGDVAYTGYGFTPVGLLIIAVDDGLYGASIGSSEPALAEHCIYLKGVVPTAVANIIYIGGDANHQKAVVKTYDADGFTLTWTKGANPGAGTINMHVFAFQAGP